MGPPVPSDRPLQVFRRLGVGRGDGQLIRVVTSLTLTPSGSWHQACVLQVFGNYLGPVTSSSLWVDGKNK